MDPDVALATALDQSLTQAERRRAGLDLQGWLLRGGFPPSERVVRAAGVTSRRQLTPGARCYLFLERVGRGWGIYFSGDVPHPIAQVWRLRPEAPAAASVARLRRETDDEPAVPLQRPRNAS